MQSWDKPISSFYLSNCQCAKEQHNYFSRKCCQGECPTGGTLTPTLSIKKGTIVTYYQFENVIEDFVVKRGRDKGKTKETTRTERVIYRKDAEEVTKTLIEVKQVYLLHLYQLAHDSFHWKNILAANVPIFHMDFSENISLTPKHEVQDAHFNERQASLHCSR